MLIPDYITGFSHNGDDVSQGPYKAVDAWVWPDEWWGAWRS